MSRSYTDYLRWKTSNGRLTEFFNDCHGEDGKFCETHGITHRSKPEAKAGTPGGAQAGKTAGIPLIQLATTKPRGANRRKYAAGDKHAMSLDLITDEALPKVIARMAEVPGFEDFKGRTDREAIDEIVERQAGHIEDTYNRAIEMGEDTAIAHADWYPFVNRWAHDLSAQTGFPPEAIMGALAVLSPGADWGDNVAWGKTLVETIAQEKNIKVSKDWLIAQQEAADSSHLAKQKKNERDNAKLIAQGKEPKPFTIKEQEAGVFKDLADRPISELTPDEAAIAIRGAHEHYGKMVHQLGGMAGFGEERKIARPQSADNLAKAISILRNPSAENIDTQLGDAHKVRSFFQNMRDPLDRTSQEVTVDSHHLGIALGLPVTGNHPITKSILGAPKVDGNGLIGTYPITVEATRRVTARINKAHGTNYTPAQIQSITWEAQRAMWNLKPESSIQAVGAVRSLYQRGKITKAERDSRIESIRTSPPPGKKKGNPTIKEIGASFTKELKRGR